MTPYLQELKQRMNKIREELVSYVYEASKVQLDKFREKLIELTGFSDEEADSITKLELARHLNIQFLNQKGGQFIALTTLRQQLEDKKRFLGAITSELLANSQRIDLLIEHNQTKGNFREHLLRNVLKKYLPGKFEVATGFIDGCKRQCDILIYDGHNYSPYFKEEGLVVIPAKSLRAVIEVKTTLNTSTLKDGLSLLDEISRTRNFPVPFFKGIFAFRTEYMDVTSASQVIKEYYNRIDDVINEPNEVQHLFQVVDAVSVLNSHYIQTELIDLHRNDQTIRPRVYSAISDISDLNISGTSFFSKMFAYLNVEATAKQNNNSYFKELDYHTKFKKEAEITDIDWKPSFRFGSEHTGTDVSIAKRVEDFLNWQQGYISLKEFEDIYSSNPGGRFKLHGYYKRPSE